MNVLLDNQHMHNLTVNVLLRCHHSVTMISGGKFFLFGGRHSPKYALADPCVLEVTKEQDESTFTLNCKPVTPSATG